MIPGRVYPQVEGSPTKQKWYAAEANMDKIEFACPKCHKLIKAPKDAGGKKSRCPGCTQELLIPVATIVDANQAVAQASPPSPTTITASVPVPAPKTLPATPSFPQINKKKWLLIGGSSVACLFLCSCGVLISILIISIKQARERNNQEPDVANLGKPKIPEEMPPPWPALDEPANPKPLPKKTLQEQFPLEAGKQFVGEIDNLVGISPNFELCAVTFPVKGGERRVVSIVDLKTGEVITPLKWDFGGNPRWVAFGNNCTFRQNHNFRGPMNQNFPRNPRLPELRHLEKLAPERVCCAEFSTGPFWHPNYP